MKKAIVFGIGDNYKAHRNAIPVLYDVEIIALVDNDKSKHGTIVDGFKVLPPDYIKNKNADIIIVMPIDSKEIVSQIKAMVLSPPPEVEVFSGRVDYNKLIKEQLGEYIDFTDNIILDVGCGSGDRVKSIAEECNPKYITGIDCDLKWWNSEERQGVNYCIKNGNAEALEFDDNTFDAVYGISVLEHINDIDKALSEIKRALKPNGRFFSTHNMPLWTSVFGHHFIAANDNWNYEHLQLIPPWGHLYLSEEQMREHLTYISSNYKLNDSIIKRIYHSHTENRLSRTELLTSIINSGMSILMLKETVCFNRFHLIHEGFKKSELTSDIVQKISETNYSINDIGILGISLCLEKVVYI